MNQILVTEKIYVTPELKRKKEDVQNTFCDFNTSYNSFICCLYLCRI